jgi:proton-dependent oligopeptide transporter, POT family
MISISLLWLVASYFFQTIAELLISPAGLTLVSDLAPSRYAGLAMGGWFFAIAIANKIAGTLAGHSATMPAHTFYWLIAAGSWITAALVIALSKKLTWLAKP